MKINESNNSLQSVVEDVDTMKKNHARKNVILETKQEIYQWHFYILVWLSQKVSRHKDDNIRSLVKKCIIYLDPHCWCGGRGKMYIRFFDDSKGHERKCIKTWRGLWYTSLKICKISKRWLQNPPK